MTGAVIAACAAGVRAMAQGQRMMDDDAPTFGRQMIIEQERLEDRDRNRKA